MALKQFLFDLSSIKKSMQVSLACIIHAFSLMQMRGVKTRRHSNLFQGFSNETDALK